MNFPDRATAAFFAQPPPVCAWEPTAEDLERMRACAVAEKQDAIDDLRSLPGHLGAAARARLDGVAETSAKSAKRKARKERAKAAKAAGKEAAAAAVPAGGPVAGGTSDATSVSSGTPPAPGAAARLVAAAQLAAAEKAQRAAAERLAEWAAARGLTLETHTEMWWARMVCGAVRMALRSRVVLKWRPLYGWRRLVKRLLGPPLCGVPEPGCMTLVDELLEYRQIQRQYRARGGFVDDDEGDGEDCIGGGPSVDYEEMEYDPEAAFRWQAAEPVNVDAWVASLLGVRGGA